MQAGAQVLRFFLNPYTFPYTFPFPTTASSECVVVWSIQHSTLRDTNERKKAGVQGLGKSLAALLGKIR